jgi:hypothetical protein
LVVSNKWQLAAKITIKIRLLKSSDVISSLDFLFQNEIFTVRCNYFLD